MTFDNDLFLMPTDAEGIIVDCYLNRILCFLPESVKKITLSLVGGTQEIEVVVPRQIWVQSLAYHHRTHTTLNVDQIDVDKFFAPAGSFLECKCNECLAIPRFTSTFKLYQYFKGGRIGVFNFANVSSEAGVCWGAFNTPPSNLRRAVQQFWTCPFNSDYYPDGREHPNYCQRRNHKCGNANHVLNGTGLRCQQSHICGERQQGSRCYQPHKCAVRESGNYCTVADCACCAISRTYYAADCTCKACRCCDNRCACKTLCECCRHHNLRGCNCPCGCGLMDRFIEHLKKFSKNEPAWTSTLQEYFVRDYSAILGASDAVLITENRTVVSLFPTDDLINVNSRSILVARAFKQLEGWDIISKSGVFVFIPNERINVCAKGAPQVKSTYITEYQTTRSTAKMVKKLQSCYTKHNDHDFRRILRTSPLSEPMADEAVSSRGEE